VRTLLQPAFYRYIRHLPPRMVIGKLVHTAKGRLLIPRIAKSSRPPRDFDWASAFSRDEIRGFAGPFSAHGDRFAATCGKLRSGEFVSNGVTHSFGDPGEVHWTNSVHPSPNYYRWHHDLAFFFFAIPLITQHPEDGIPTVAAMVRALEQQCMEDPSELRRFHWSPIAVASRTLALTTALSLTPREHLQQHSDDVGAIGAHIWRATDLLEYTVERYLGFNHAATTEAGLAMGLLVQGRDHAAKRSLSRLIATLEEGTLRDGLWAERSPSYHIYMYILANAVASVVEHDSDEHHRVHALSDRMRSALNAVVHPDGEIALFNDAAIADAPAPTAVGWSAGDARTTIVLPVAGYARLASEDTVVIMDAGPMGPDAVIGHGHADFLSIEVSIGKRRLIVDPGVAAVTAGADRDWTRSSSSHNGPTLDGYEPVEFFGAWRVGRRGNAWFDEVATDPTGPLLVSGSCNGYARAGVSVKRELRLDPDGRLTISDNWFPINAGLDHAPVVSLLVPHEWTVHRVADTGVVFTHTDGVVVTLDVSDGNVVTIEPSRSFPTGPMREEPATRVEIAPDRQKLTLTITPPSAAGG
jgi:hypothetical protein